MKTQEPTLEGIEAKAVSVNREDNGDCDWVAYDLGPSVLAFLNRFCNLDGCPHERVAPWREILIEEELYYFTPGGFLYRKDMGVREVGGVFCGYVSDRIWQARLEEPVGFASSRPIEKHHQILTGTTA